MKWSITITKKTTKKKTSKHKQNKNSKNKQQKSSFYLHFNRQPRKIIKQIMSVFEHFVGLALNPIQDRGRDKTATTTPQTIPVFPL